ncbi:MAG: hypothetical protein M0C28_44440 [Candidatus Moduliflexus flocculans]|nr:hypothetical protein [Candidatus Moduliflexus flocculans]
MTFWIGIEALINMAVMVGLHAFCRQRPALHQRGRLEPGRRHCAPSASC